MIRAYASVISAGTLLSEGAYALSGPENLLGAFVAAYVGIYHWASRGREDESTFLVTPAADHFMRRYHWRYCGASNFRVYDVSMATSLTGELSSSRYLWVCSICNYGNGATLPISSAALGIIPGLNGI